MPRLIIHAVQLTVAVLLLAAPGADPIAASPEPTVVLEVPAGAQARLIEQREEAGLAAVSSM